MHFTQKLAIIMTKLVGNYTTIYDLTHEGLGFSAFSILPLMLLIFVPLILYTQIKSGGINKVNKSRYVIFSTFFCGICLLLIIATSPFIKPGYWETKEAFRNKTFKVIEGVVENFDPMPKSGHKHESFSVAGVEFEYGDYDVSVFGFNNAASHGGPIKKKWTKSKNRICME